MIEYTVRSGDSLWVLARRFNTTVERIVLDNDIKNRNLIHVGQRLRIRETHEPPKPVDKLIIKEIYYELEFVRFGDRLDASKVTAIVVHHSTGKRDNITPYGLARFHVRKKKWWHIGYHYVITGNGQVFLCLPPGEMGYHAGPNWNGRSYGVCLTGNFEEEIPNQSQVASLKALLAHLQKQKKLSLFGHREVRATTCPGRNLFATVEEIRQ